MSRLPIRLRLTAVFVAVMAVVLGAIGLWVYLQTKHAIDASIAQSLRSRQSALRAYAQRPPAGARSRIPSAERFAQLLALDGRLIESRPAGERPMLSPASVRRAAGRAGIFERHEVDRYYAGPVIVDGRRAVAVTATSLAQHERALEGLGGALLIGGPLALLLAGAIAYAVAAGALRPVELMRRRAATISRAEPGATLPVPEVDDELRRLSTTLNEMLERLTRSADAERRLIADASHELRTPLAALRAELALGGRPGVSDDDLMATVRRARGDVERLVALSDALLEVSTIEGGAAPARRPVAAAELLEEVAGDLRARAGAAGRVLRVEPTDVVVHADRATVRRALANLAENALVHGRGTVALGAEATGDEVVLWVSDEGTIDPRVQAVAFDRFARGPEAAGRPGSGLGLSLVRAVAQRHGGSAGLRAHDGGVRAEIRLPPGLSARS